MVFVFEYSKHKLIFNEIEASVFEHKINFEISSDCTHELYHEIMSRQ